MGLSVAERSRRYRLAHPERAKAACLAWVKKNPEKMRAKSKRARRAAAGRERSARYKATKAAKAKRYQRKHADHLRAYLAKYQIDNRERLRAHGHEYWKLHGERGRAQQKMANQQRRAWIDALKDKPCMDCGGRFPPCAMDFDHVRGVKCRPVCQLFNAAKDRVLSEIEKCDLVCANCHRIRTHARRQSSVSLVA